MQWEILTKRTNDPKLSWVERELTRTGIGSRRNGESYHAPILEVDASKIDTAWRILEPIDDVPDDHYSFEKDFELCETPPVDDEESSSHFDRFIAGDR